MMKKKISILILTILFLVSTTGLPIWSHYCEMIGKKTLNECTDCTVETESACCSEEDSENSLKLTSAASSCCFDEFDYKKIEDDFSVVLKSNISLSHLLIESIHSAKLDPELKKFSIQSNYDLPPPKSGKQLLNSLHQLKIDLPSC